MEDFIKYITYAFGLSVSAEPAQVDKSVPLYLKHSYTLFKGQVAGRAIMWAKVGEEPTVTPDRLKGQKHQLERLYGAPIVFVFDRLDSWQRKRLIEKQVGFVQTNKQLYIPELMLQLNDIRSGHRAETEDLGHITFSTQVALFYHIERESLERQSGLEIANKLGYSAMTVTRIIRELQQMEWITIHPGKERTFSFAESPKKLWGQALPRLRSPIRETWFTDGPIPSPGFTEAGETALSRYTMLAGREVADLAISKEQFKSLRAMEKLPELNSHYGRFRLQVWQYEPRILAELGSNSVDRLSLYQTLKDELDERIQDALQDMLKQISW